MRRRPLKSPGKGKSLAEHLASSGPLPVERAEQIATRVLEALRAGTIAEPVPVMIDGSTFAIHGTTRTFWVKLWHAAGSEMTKIDRAQVISCLPSTRGVQVVVESPEED